jgi:hypothetical protein
MTKTYLDSVNNALQSMHTDTERLIRIYQVIKRKLGKHYDPATLQYLVDNNCISLVNNNCSDKSITATMFKLYRINECK